MAVRHYYLCGYEWLEDEATDEEVAKPENGDPKPEDLLLWERLYARWQAQNGNP